MTEIEKLLAVPDMTEEEQRDWLWNNKLIHEDESLADLAFRRRDEVKKEHKEQWLRACFIVSEHLFNPKGGREYRSFRGFEAEHEILQGKAIWWIIAAEITEQLAKKQ